MKRLFGILVLVAVLAGCDRPLVVYNGCVNSWLMVQDGRGNILADIVDFGGSHELDIGGAPGGRVELLALGFEPGTNRPLGSARTTIHIPRAGDGPVSPQLEAWRVTSLETSDPRGGCRPREERTR